MITATRSPIVIASVWSCVTYIVVVPSRVWMPRDLGAHLDPELRVEVRQRLVHQERLRLAHDRAAHRHPLALPARRAPSAGGRGARSNPRIAAASRTRRSVSSFVDLPHLERERHVLADGHVRVQRVVLEDHRDVALPRRQVVHDPLADPGLPAGDRLEPRHHPKRRRLAAARGADQDHELAVGDVEVERGDRLGPVGVDLRQLLEDDLGHVLILRRAPR